MSLLAWVWFAVGILVAVLVVVAAIVLANLVRVLAALTALIDGISRQTVPLLGEVRSSVTIVNGDLGRVDGILASGEEIAGSVARLTDVLQRTVTGPLIKVSAVTVGVRRGLTRLRTARVGRRR